MRNEKKDIMSFIRNDVMKQNGCFSVGTLACAVCKLATIQRIPGVTTRSKVASEWYGHIMQLDHEPQ